MNFVAFYLMVKSNLEDFLSDRQGNEQTGMLLNIVITVVIAGIVLASVRSFLPELWTQITSQITKLWEP